MITRNGFITSIPICCVLALVGLPGFEFMGLADTTNQAISPIVTESKLGYPDWGLGPFVRSDANPILKPIEDAVFHDPILDQDVFWESLNVVAASVAVYKGQINLVYRAEAKPKAAFHSRQGLAWSDDGLHFQRLPQPVFYATKDDFQKYEWPGGTEDGRIVERDDGLFVMIYPAYDGKTARQCVATSPDLRQWTKHGPVFAQARAGKYLNLWSKSGTIVSRYFEDGRVVATKINGKYWMYVGDKIFFVATSDDLINWTPVETHDGKIENVLPARQGFFDAGLTEPGPPPIITPKGILVLYNGMNRKATGNPNLPEKAYSGGQALFDLHDPTKLIARSDDYFITPTEPYELHAQFVPVCFIDGMIRFRGKWWLYYDGGDKVVCLATCDAPGLESPHAAPSVAPDSGNANQL